MRPYGFYWILMGPYRLLFVLMDFNGFECAHIGP